RLAADHNTRPFITFLMVTRRLRPGWDYLTARKLSSFWRELDGSVLQPDLDQFMAMARQLGFTDRVASAVASQIIARLLIQTGRCLEQLTEQDLADLIDACRARQASTGRGWRHYRGALHTARQVLFRSDIPRLPRPLPRYLPVDADRRLTEALAASSYRLAADALLLQRACGLRIGELLDLELDCVHEVPGQGSWLKVPLGKLETERMVPLDEETLVLIDRIAGTRSAGRPIPHARTGRPAQFL